MGRLKDDILFWAALLASPPALLCAVAVDCRGGAAVAAFLGFYAAWFLGLILAWVVLVWLISLTVDLSKPVPEDHPVTRWLVITIIGLLCKAGRLRITLRGLENLPEGRFLLVGNHRSNYDPIAAVWALRQRGVDVAFVTKPENMKIPLVRLIHRANYLVIDREDPRKAVHTINAAADLLTGDVVNVGIYPEGTRSKSGEMLPFHNAVFKIAKRADVPIVVAATAGTERIHKNAPWRRTKVTIDLCGVIGREEVAASSTKELGERTLSLLQTALAKQ